MKYARKYIQSECVNMIAMNIIPLKKHKKVPSCRKTHITSTVVQKTHAKIKPHIQALFDFCVNNNFATQLNLIIVATASFSILAGDGGSGGKRGKQKAV